MARGLSQKEAVDYEDTLASVAGYTSIRAIMSLVSFMGWRIHQMDVKIAFLNGIIEEEVYIEQPQGFEVNGKEFHVRSAVRDWSLATMNEFDRSVYPASRRWVGCG